MNINEFERLKPQVTYNKIQEALSKWKGRLTREEDDESCALYCEFVEDLKSIKKSFLAGE
jgi:hypothetical protein